MEWVSFRFYDAPTLSSSRAWFSALDASQVPFPIAEVCHPIFIIFEVITNFIQRRLLPGRAAGRTRLPLTKVSRVGRVPGTGCAGDPIPLAPALGLLISLWGLIFSRGAEVHPQSLPALELCWRHVIPALFGFFFFLNPQSSQILNPLSLSPSSPLETPVIGLSEHQKVSMQRSFGRGTLWGRPCGVTGAAATTAFPLTPQPQGREEMAMLTLCCVDFRPSLNSCDLENFNIETMGLTKP